MITNPTCSRLLTLSISLSCNLNCVYCYENKHNKVFSVSEAIALLSEELKTPTEKGTVIKLHGGEPFLVFPQIKELCETLWNAGFKEEFVIHTTTNGTLVHGDIQNWLFMNQNRFVLKLSIDGDKATHDKNRSGSFDLIDIPFFVRTWPDIKVNMTITPDSIPDIYHNVVFLHSVGFKNIFTHFECLKQWYLGNSNRLLYEQLCKLVSFYIKNPELKPCLLLQHSIERILENDHDTPLCPIGRKKVYDFDSKQCYPCHLFFPSVTGKELDDTIQHTDFSRRSNMDSSRCLKCVFVNICFTCYADNYIMRGSLSNRDMCMCQLNKVCFLATCQLEYQRITKKDTPNYQDFLKMKAIEKLLPELNDIEQNI